MPAGAARLVPLAAPVVPGDPSTMNMLSAQTVLASILYAVIGVIVLWVSFALIDKLTPYKLWDEIVERKNLALAVVVGAMFIAIGQIVAAAIHG